MLPFEEALGPSAALATPRVRERFLQREGSRRYQGRMDRIWRARGLRGWLAYPLLWLSSRLHMLFPDTGMGIRFEVENIVTPLAGGRASMTWTRTFHFPARDRVFHATMVYDPRRRLIDDRLGRSGRLEVELRPVVEDGGLSITSGRQWLHLGRLRIRIPGWLAGRARIREWERPDGRLGIKVTISNPLLGDFFGYEGSFERVD